MERTMFACWRWAIICPCSPMINICLAKSPLNTQLPAPTCTHSAASRNINVYHFDAMQEITDWLRRSASLCVGALVRFLLTTLTLSQGWSAASGGKRCDNNCSALRRLTIPVGAVWVQSLPSLRYLHFRPCLVVMRIT